MTGRRGRMTLIQKRSARRIAGDAAMAASLLMGACAAAPPAEAPPLALRQKLAVAIQLEQQRVIGPPAGAVVPLPTLAPGTPSPPMPDLLDLLRDSEARVRRRSAIALGRVGLPEAVAPLAVALSDSNPAVRRMVAFALGGLGDAAAGDVLLLSLGDPDPLVRGRAAEALGRLGVREAAETIGQMISELVPAAAALDPDDMTYPQAPPVEAFRLGIMALARLAAYEPLASAVLDANNLPTVRWWPVAWALQRLGDPRAAAALADLVSGSGSVRIAFAAIGLGRLGEPAAAELLLPLLDPSRYDSQVMIAAVRALGDLDHAQAAPAMMQLIRSPDLDPLVILEVVRALGRLNVSESIDLFLDLLSHPWATMRAAALRALGGRDPQTFLLVLSGFDADPHWSVRAAMAEVLGAMNPDFAVPRVQAMLTDGDRRVRPAVLAALGALRAPGVAATALQQLQSEDPVTRMAAARLTGLLRPAGGAEALTRAYETSQGGQSAGLRRAVVDAIGNYGGTAAAALLTAALEDEDWSVRVRAATQLDGEDSFGAFAHRIRPVAGPQIDLAQRLADPDVSAQVYLDTDRGTIQIELAVLDAPLATHWFADLAASGYFDGASFHEVVPNGVVLGGDPRGDGFGGSGTVVRDEVSGRPILRGTVGMALQEGVPETSDGQFFIALTPQPDMDGRYTVLGRVVEGMDVVDRLAAWDVIRRTRVWDGASMIGRE